MAAHLPWSLSVWLLSCAKGKTETQPTSELWMGPFTTSKLLHYLSFTSFLSFLPSLDTNAKSGSQHICSFKELGGPKTTQSQSQDSDIWLDLAYESLGELGKVT